MTADEFLSKVRERLLWGNADGAPEHKAELIASAPTDLSKLVRALEVARGALKRERFENDLKQIDDICGE